MHLSSGRLEQRGKRRGHSAGDGDEGLPSYRRENSSRDRSDERHSAGDENREAGG